jgi:hypothetical protein
MSLFSGVAMHSANAHSKKTFLAPRAIGTNLPMELVAWHELAYQKLDPREGHTILSHLALTPFYQGSEQQDDLGKYFGIGNGTNSFVVGTGSSVDINSTNLIHDYGVEFSTLAGGASPTLAGDVKFSPNQEIWGFRFDYFQNFGHPCHGLFFKASMPVVWVRNTVGMKISDSVSEQIGSAEFSLADFFAGKVNVDSPADFASLQAPLAKAKIDGHRSKFGVADINLALGYKIHQTKKDHVFLSAQIIVPTGSRPSGEYLFQPVIGEGKHFGLGARLDGAVNIWSNKHATIRALLDVDYRYLFESTEHRTIGVSGLNLGHYYMAGKLGQVAQPLFPAANILTQGIKVKPGSQLDILADFSFKSGGFIIDLGYNFFYKDAEDCWRKGSWSDGVYALASNEYSTNAVFGNKTTDIYHPLNKTDLCVDAVKTPTQITNKIVAGIGYEFDYAKSVPGLVGIGGSYEFACSNSALETYAVWLKLGVSF